MSDADIESLHIGDVFYLTGALITSRDMVHFRHVEEGMDLPVDLAGKAIFHAGPIMVPDDKNRSGFRVVSIGPTTSMRMEKYEREFLDAPLPIYDWKGILGVVTPILVTTQFGQ